MVINETTYERIKEIWKCPAGNPFGRQFKLFWEDL